MSSETLIFDPRGDVVLILERKPKDTPGTADSSTTQGSSPGIDALPSTLVNMLVSSGHMSLASTVFAAMLKPHFLEGSILKSNGRVEISLPDEEPDMFTILLNIVHGRTKKVPRRFNLRELTEISVLVDKYQMVEVAGAFVEIWIERFDLEDQPPEDEKDVLRWLCISWVFDKGDIFEDATEALIRMSDSEFDKDVMDELPIPEVITQRIQFERREGAIASMLLVIQDLLGNYQRTKNACKRDHATREACDAMALGSLLRSTQKARLWPFPEPPYQNLTVEGLKDAILEFEIKTLCDISEPLRGLDCHKGKLLQSQVYCIQPTSTMAGDAIKESIATKVNSLSDLVCGLKIEDFKRKTVFQT